MMQFYVKEKINTQTHTTEKTRPVELKFLFFSWCIFQTVWSTYILLLWEKIIVTKKLSLTTPDEICPILVVPLQCCLSYFILHHSYNLSYLSSLWRVQTSWKVHIRLISHRAQDLSLLNKFLLNPQQKLIYLLNACTNIIALLTRCIQD